MISSKEVRKNFCKDIGIVVFLALLAFIPRLYLLITRSPDLFFNEEVMSQSVFGLMGKHILDGKPMVYMYGQGYMGSIESFLAAFYYLWNGINPFSLQLSVLTLYVLFIIVNSILLKKAFGWQVSIVANTYLALSPPFLTRMSLYSYGGYNGTLLFGSLTLLILFYFKENPLNKIFLFLAGLAAGIGFWTHNLILIYFISLGIFLLLRSSFWKENYRHFAFKKLIFLERLVLPWWARALGIAVNLAILFFLVFSAASFLIGHQTIGIGSIHLETFSLPFRVKDMKKVFLIILLEGIVASYLIFGFKKIKEVFKNFFPLITGFGLGASPVIYYSIFDDQGYRQIHTSGMVFVQELPKAFEKVVGQALFGQILNIPRNESILAIFLFGLLSIFCFQNRSELASLLFFKPKKYSNQIFPVIFTFVLLIICILNNIGSTAARYLLPLYFSFSSIFGSAIHEIRKKSKVLSILLFVFLITSNIFSTAAFFQALPKARHNQSYESIIQVLEKDDIAGAYSHCDIGYPITFLSGERIIVAAYQSVSRIPWYHDKVKAMNRVAYIFGLTDDHLADFEKKLRVAGVPYKKMLVDDFAILEIDRSVKSEKGIVDV